MASTTTPRIYVFKADAAIAKGAAVKIGTDSQHVVACTGPTDKICGWAQVACTTAEDKVEVALQGGGAKAVCGAVAVSKGDLLTAGAAGVAVSTTSNADHYAGQAMEDAVSGDIFAIEVVIGIV